MRLVIVSDTAISNSEQGLMALEAPLREIEEIAKSFDSVVWIGFFYEQGKYNTRLPRVDNIKLVSMPSSGGNSFFSKLRVLFHIPLYYRTILSAMIDADAVHLRAPSVPAIIAMYINSFKKINKGWIKYAGTWTEDAPLSYRFQRWLIKRNPSLNATILQKDSEEGHLHYMVNPAIYNSDLNMITKESIKKNPDKINIIFVGTLDSNKRPGAIINAVKRIYSHHLFGDLYIFGSGPLENQIKLDAKGFEKIHIMGQANRSELDRYYKKAHIVAVPSRSEGFPKVIAEGALFGCVPLASNLDGISGVIAHKSTGWLIDEDRFEENLYIGLKELLDSPSLIGRLSSNIFRIRKQFTYEKFHSGVINISGCNIEVNNRNEN